MKKFLLISISILSINLSAQAQNEVTLQQCYQLAEANFPYLAQQNIVQSITDEAINKINAIWQPQVYLNAQATYQSDVTSIGLTIPGIEINELSKDQYKATLDVNQVLYDGGVSKQQRSIQMSGAAVETQKITVDIYKVRERVNQLFLILLQTDKQQELVNNLKLELNNQEEKIKAGKLFGTATQFQADILAAEIIKADQRTIEINAARETAINMLNLLTGSNFNSNSKFVTPEVNINTGDTLNLRPEIKLFDLQEALALSQMSFAEAATLPKLSLFVQGGYGRPGLNFLDDTFQFYYIGGIKFSYPIWTGNTKTNDAAIYQLNAQNVMANKTSFLINNNIQSAQQLGEIKKYTQLIEKDNAIIALKANIKKGAQAQLDNGTLAADDFVKYLTDENEAKINLAIHQVQLLSAQINYLTLLGKL